MSGLHLLAMLAIPVFLAADSAQAQATGETPAVMSEGEQDAWSFSASAYVYLVPDSDDYVQPTITADWGRLHLEARYNYEDLDTASAWIGYNFSFGRDLTLDLTAMVGGVFGNTTGIAPGCRASLGWWQLELSNEAEYVFDTSDSSADFFYSWSELTWAPSSWFRFGMVVQRTEVYETVRDIQRGLLVGFSRGRVDFAAYVFNPDEARPMVVLAASVSF